MAKVLLISETTLKKYTLISDQVDGKYLLPAIGIAQDVDLDTLIGPALNEKLQYLVENNLIGLPANAHYKLLLDKYITPYLCWQVMSSVQIAVNYKMSNSGVIENQDERKSRMGYSDSKALQTQYDRYASSYAQKLKNYLCKNSNLYPEYRTCENFERAEEAQLCSIYLGDIPSNRYNYIGK